MMTEQRPRAIEPETLPRDDDAVRWLVFGLREMMLVFLAYVAKRYPEMRQKHECSHCGWRE